MELYGAMGKFSYAVAVQNGGANQEIISPATNQSPAALIRPNEVAALKRKRDAHGRPRDRMIIWSELYFANGWFVPIGGTNMTRYVANLVEGDVIIRLPHGRIHAFGGYARYDDNDPGANNKRDIWFYSVEGVYDITRKFYTAARFGRYWRRTGINWSATARWTTSSLEHRRRSSGG